MKKKKILRIFRYKDNKNAITPPNYLRPTQFNKIKERAESSGMEFNVTLEYLTQLFIQQKELCKFTNTPLYHYSRQRLSGKKQCLGNASLFRIDKSKGYVIGNVCWVDKDVMKNRNFYTQCITDEVNSVS